MIKNYPDYPEFKADLGVLYLRWKKFAKARRFFEQALSEDPQEAGWHWRLGVIYEKMQEESKALEEYRKAADLGYKNWNLYFKLATLFAQHKDARAEYFFRKASLLVPWEAKVWFNWGLFCVERGKIDRGKQYLAKAEKLGYKISKELRKMLEKRGIKF